MKAPTFSYTRPDTLPELCDLLAKHGESSAVLAGGQSLVPLLNMRLANASLIIDINHVAELNGISKQGDHLVIGALSRHVEVHDSALVREHVPIIAEALSHVAHPAIRNRGTFGGSIALADPAAELPACCVAIEAEFVLQSNEGTRTLPAEDFFLGPLTTARRTDEIIVAIRVPLPSHPERFSFEEVTRRQGDYAMAGLAAVLELTAPRFVFFGIGDKPLLAKELGALVTTLDPSEINQEALDTALDRDLTDLVAGEENADLKRHLAGVLAVKAIKQLGSTEQRFKD